MSEQPEPLLIDAKECAALLGLHRKTWVRWDAGGRVPAPVIRGHACTRWRRAELLAWVAAGCPGRKEWEAAKG